MRRGRALALGALVLFAVFLLRETRTTDLSAMSPFPLDADVADERHDQATSERVVEAANTVNRRRHTSSELVCIVGNSETVERAWDVHMMWGNVYPSVWYVWGKGTNASQTSRMTVVTHEESLPWTRGIEYAVAETRKRYECHYFFTHDDDLVFTVRPESPVAGSSITSVLNDYLTDYRPAVAGFLWSKGLTALPNFREIHQAFVHERVAPLTAFDTGMLIYHRSVVDMFIPYAPRGEGGLYGNWTLCASFMHLFIPSVFREHAILLNDLHYENMINLDNLNAAAKKQFQQVGDLVVHEESRHPYEYRLNKRYQDFLSRGLRSPNMRWGRSLTLKDVTWRPSPGVYKYDDMWTLERLVNLYDVRHEGISSNVWLSGHVTQQDILEAIRAVPIQLHMFLFVDTMDDKFSRLWKSIGNQALPPPGSVGPYRVQIHLIYRPFQTGPADRQTALLRGLRMPYANITVHLLEEALDDSKTVLSLWTPSSIDEFAIFLDGDELVQPTLLSTSLAAIRRYFYDESRLQGLWGITLNWPRRSDVFPGAPALAASSPSPLTNSRQSEGYNTSSVGAPPFTLLQYAPAFGTWFWATPWNALQGWAAQLTQIPVLPGAAMNWWHRHRALQRYVARFASEKGHIVLSLTAAASLTPQPVDQQTSLSGPTPHDAVGANQPPGVGSNSNIDLQTTLDAIRATGLTGLPIYDPWFNFIGINRSPAVPRAPRFPQTEQADVCSVVVHHAGGETALREFLEHVVSAPILTIAAIVWRGPAVSSGDAGQDPEYDQMYYEFLQGDTSEEELADDKKENKRSRDSETSQRPEMLTLSGAGDLSFTVPVFDPMTYAHDALLLRDLVSSITTSCVVIVDTTWKWSLAHVDFAVNLHHTNFPANLIGMRQGSMAHMVEDRAQGSAGEPVGGARAARQSAAENEHSEWVNGDNGPADGSQVASNQLPSMVLVAEHPRAASIVASSLSIFPVSFLQWAINATEAASGKEDARPSSGTSMATSELMNQMDPAAGVRFVWRRCRSVFLSSISAVFAQAGPVIIDDLDSSSTNSQALPAGHCEGCRTSTQPTDFSTWCLRAVGAVVDRPVAPLLYTETFQRICHDKEGSGLYLTFPHVWSDRLASQS